MPLKLPYGVRDFYALRTEGYCYLDRSDRIPLWESLGKELLLLRPRRFGKSLWLSTLMNYYDVAKAAEFERLFGDLAIGQNPTPLHNQYLVMRWDFSEVQSHGSIEQIEAALHDQINGSIELFIAHYHGILELPVTISDNALRSFKSVLAATQSTPYKLYLFIDEYDNFANEVMMGQQGDNHQRYADLVKGEGMFKTFFKNIKSAASGEGLDRVFMTGVSPIVMSDVTSGSNVTESIYWLPELNDLCGFRQAEVDDLLAQVADECGLPDEQQSEALELLRIYYNGSWFTLDEEHSSSHPNPSKENARLYNPTLVFYFLKHLQRSGRYPRQMLDSNLAPDAHKLLYISLHPTGRDLLVEALNEETVVSVSEIGDHFGVQEMLQADQQHDRLASLLCYLGALTLTGQSATGKWLLTIPNLVMRKLYAERILQLTLPQPATRDLAQTASDTLFAQGEIAPLCDFVEQYLLTIYDNRDRKAFNELTLKTLFLALLHYNNLYIMDSEPALQRTYADLTMIIRPEMRHFTIYDLLLEFKYVPLHEIRTHRQKVTSQEIRQINRSELAALPVVEQALAAAQRQLLGYRQVLQQKYGPALKLRSYAVVCVGVERLVWRETG